MTDKNAADAVEADAARDPDSPIVVTLKTERGEAQISVPPLRRWRSSARDAMFSQANDRAWARVTLSPEDFKEWARLDPDLVELDKFLDAWSAATGDDPAKS